jgi:SHS2 domain-containing protein
MTYSFLEHTADVRMNVEAATREALFQDAVAGMFAVLKPSVLPERAAHVVTVRSPDASALLIDFLNETLSLAHANREAYLSVSFESLSETELRATVDGRRVSSFGDDIKAATYHEASVARDPAGVWHARVVFDI